MSFWWSWCTHGAPHACATCAISAFVHRVHKTGSERKSLTQRVCMKYYTASAVYNLRALTGALFTCCLRALYAGSVLNGAQLTYSAIRELIGALCTLMHTFRALTGALCACSVHCSFTHQFIVDVQCTMYVHMSIVRDPTIYSVSAVPAALCTCSVHWQFNHCFTVFIMCARLMNKRTRLVQAWNTTSAHYLPK